MLFSKPLSGKGICVKRGDTIINGTITGKSPDGRFQFVKENGEADVVGTDDMVVWALPDGVDRNKMTDIEDDGYPD